MDSVMLLIPLATLSVKVIGASSGPVTTVVDTSVGLSVPRLAINNGSIINL